MQSIVSAGLPVIATPTWVTQLTYIHVYIYIYIYKLGHTRKRRSQYIADNIYLNDNKCNTLAEDGDIKKRWSGYYSQILNETNRKSNYCTREKLKEKYLRYP